MTAQRWLQMHLVALCLLGSLFVALSAKDFAVPAGVLLAGVLSVWLTDIWKWFRLNRLLGNLAAIGAVLFSLREFLAPGNTSEGQLQAIATLLVYLQVILFFQEKNARLYWQMILLSLLQVVVGAALHLGIAFGGLLLAYTVVATSTLVLFYIQRETEYHAAQLEIKPMERSPGRWKRLLGQQAGVQVVGRAEQLHAAFLSSALLRQIVFFTLGALTFSAAFFYTAPRHPSAAWSGSRGFGRPETGFSRSVELQRMGELLQNDNIVMRAYLLDASGRPLPRLDPYFAGEALTHYEIDGLGKARWVASGVGNPLFRSDENLSHRDYPMAPPFAPANSTTVRLNMAQMEQSLFAIAPAYAIQGATHESVHMDGTTGLLFRSVRADGNNPTSLVIATTGIVGGQHVPITPDTRRRGRLRSEIEMCKAWSPVEEERFPGTKAAAAKILAELGLPARNSLIEARALEEHFHKPGLYQYSLNMNIKRDAALDPIEDFVVNHRTGHCQYFASALVIMLRSQGVPARMIVGFRGSEYNDLGKFYQVRQRHAHAWVEVYLEKDQVPEGEPAGGVVGNAGAWLRLEPTPGGDDAANGNENLFGTARDWLDYFDTIWTDYVVGLTQQRQQQAVYDAFKPADDSLPWMQHHAWRDSLRSVAAWFGIHIGGKDRQGIAFDWRAAVTAMVLCILAVTLFRLVRWLWSHIDWSPLNFWRRARKHRSAVAFYNRLEDLLARRGRTRRPAETPQEYVEHAVRELGLVHGDSLRRTVAAFYRVRFGGATLDNIETQAIEHALAELERISSADAARV
jgi:protein-glutamine gamma-glutamyltransferase